VVDRVSFINQMGRISRPNNTAERKTGRTMFTVARKPTPNPHSMALAVCVAATRAEVRA